MKTNSQSAIFERTALCSSVALDAIYLDLIALLFEPNAQLLQAPKGSHTAAEHEALIGFRLLACLCEYPYPYAKSALEKAISCASADALAQAASLLGKIGANVLLKKLQLLISWRSRVLKARALGSTLDPSSSGKDMHSLSKQEERLVDRIAARAFNAQAQLMQRLWLYLDSHASTLRGGYGAAQRRAACKMEMSEFKTQYADFQVGKLQILSVNSYSNFISRLLDWPGAQAFDEKGQIIGLPSDRKNSYKIAYIGAPTRCGNFPSSDLDQLTESMAWIYSVGFPNQFISSAPEHIEKFCAALTIKNQAVKKMANNNTYPMRLLSHYKGVSKPSQARHGLRFNEADCGTPAVIAAEFEQSGVWLIIKMEQHCFWFLDWTQHWKCESISNDYFLCWCDSADAILAAFSHI